MFTALPEVRQLVNWLSILLSTKCTNDVSLDLYKGSLHVSADKSESLNQCNKRTVQQCVFVAPVLQLTEQALN